jgi:hypothetical protein
MSEVIKMREINKGDKVLLDRIDRLDETISSLRETAFKAKLEFLTRNGFDISSENTGGYQYYFYEKDDEFFICEDDAIEYDLYGK